MTTTTVPTAADVERVLADLRAAREPVYDPTDPVQAVAAALLRAEDEVAAEDESVILPREVFADPEALAALFADSAEAHGFPVRRDEHTRRTLLLWARTLPQILIESGTEDPEMGAAAAEAAARLVEEIGGAR